MLKKDLQKIKSKNLILKIILFLIVSIIIINIYLKNEYGNYLILDRCSVHKLKIKKIKKYKGILFINDSLRLATSYNNIKPILMLGDFIKVGDSLLLKPSNDTLIVFRNKEKHWFIYYAKDCNFAASEKNL
jgi:hypothetical protein